MRTRSRQHPQRRYIEVLVTVVAALSLAAPAASAARPPACPDGGGWSQFHAGPAKTGWNCAENVLSPDTVPGVVRQWSEGGNAFTSSPVIAGDLVFFTSETVTASSDTTDLLAVHRSTGSTAWATRLSASPIIPPGVLAYADGLVLLVVDRTLEAYTSATGALAWSRPVGSSRGPTVRDHTAYLGTTDRTVEAVSTTGASVWTVTLPGEVSSELAVSDKEVFVAAGSELFSLKRSTGAVRWHRSIGEVFGGGTAVRDKTVYVAANVPSEGGVSVLYAFHTSSGHLIWSADAGGDVHSVPTVDDQNVYIGSIDTGVRAFSASSGARRWVQTFGGEEVWSSLASANGVVYLTTDVDHALALDATTGEVLLDERPSLETSFADVASPAVDDGRVYFPFGNSGVISYGLPGQS